MGLFDAFKHRGSEQTEPPGEPVDSAMDGEPEVVGLPDSGVQEPRHLDRSAPPEPVEAPHAEASTTPGKHARRD